MKLYKEIDVAKHLRQRDHVDLPGRRADPDHHEQRRRRDPAGRQDRGQGQARRTPRLCASPPRSRSWTSTFPSRCCPSSGQSRSCSKLSAIRRRSEFDAKGNLVADAGRASEARGGYDDGRRKRGLTGRLGEGRAADKRERHRRLDAGEVRTSSISTPSAAWPATCSSPPCSTPFPICAPACWRRFARRAGRERRMRKVVEHRDAALTGLRFCESTAASPARGARTARSLPDSAQPHTPFADIRAQLEGCALAPTVRAHAIGIFTLLAEAEGKGARHADRDGRASTSSAAGIRLPTSSVPPYLIAALAPADLDGERAAAGLRPGEDRITAAARSDARHRATARGIRIRRRRHRRRARHAHGGRDPAPSGAARSPPRASPRRLLRSGIGFGTRTFRGMQQRAARAGIRRRPGESGSDDRSPDQLRGG